MESSMDGSSTTGENNSWLQHQFTAIVNKNKNIEVKIDEMQDRIVGLKKEHRKILRRHDRITEASNLLEFLCKIFHSANQKLRDGNPTRMKTEWGNLSAISETKDDGPVTMLIERIQKMHINSDESKELPQGVESMSEEGGCIFERKKLLAAELELGLQFSPSISVLEDDLVNQNKLLRLERSQLEDRIKRTLATFARIKLDLSKHENECYRLQNILLRNSSALSVPITKKIEINQMSSDIKEIEKKNTIMICQWQAYHNVLCGTLDDVRMFNSQSVKDCEKVWYLCRSCKQLNVERLELIYQLMGTKYEGHN